jgi:hypothetical protein
VSQGEVVIQFAGDDGCLVGRVIFGHHGQARRVVLSQPPRRAFTTSSTNNGRATTSATTTRTMAEDNYRDYLVARVVTEQKPITYRLLSRVLKTNVNTAKRSVQSVQLFECELT